MLAETRNSRVFVKGKVDKDVVIRLDIGASIGKSGKSGKSERCRLAHAEQNERQRHRAPTRQHSSNSMLSL